MNGFFACEIVRNLVMLVAAMNDGDYDGGSYDDNDDASGGTLNCPGKFYQRLDPSCDSV